MKITSFDRQNLKILRIEMDAALKTIGDKYGIMIRLGNISFLSESFKGKIEAFMIERREGLSDQEMRFLAGLKSDGYKFGFRESDFKKIIDVYGKSYVFVGIKTGSRKNPVILKNKFTGKYFRYPVLMVSDLIKNSTKKEK